MLRDNFWLDGEDAAAKNITLQKEIEFEAAEPVTEAVKIPGKDGEIVYYDGSFKNVRGLAKCFVLGYNAAFNLTDVNSWLLSKTGYRRLQTLHEPHFFRLARITHGARLDPRLNLLNAFEIEFDCKPYKYYNDGEIPVELTASGELVGPTPFYSLPLIVVHGSGAGTVTINGDTLSLTDSNEITLDSEAQDAIRGSANMNGTVSGTYPRLGQSNTVSFSGGVTSLTITPRWRTI